MPRPPYSEAQREAMRTRIVDAAWALLQQQGPKGLSTRGIAGVVGMSPMALYTYFPNRAAILQALAERETASFRDRQRALEAEVAQGADPAATVRRSLQLFIELEHDQPDLFHLAVVMPEAAQAGAPGGRARSRQQQHVAHLAMLIRVGMQQGRFRVRDPILAASAVLGMVTFPMLLFHNGRLTDPVLRDRLVVEMVGAAIGYLTFGGVEAGPGPEAAGP